MTLRTAIAAAVATVLTGAPSPAPVKRPGLCVTLGSLGESARGAVIEAAKLRAVTREASGPPAELRFRYLGHTTETAPLASGVVRRQIGLKLRAESGCNVVYAMWRLEPESALVVSVKRNPGLTRHAECGARGYSNVSPTGSAPLPAVAPGTEHRLGAALDGRSLRVTADGTLVWEGALPAEAFAFDGPTGFRSDNVRAEVELLASPAAAAAPAASRCGEGSGDE